MTERRNRIVVAAACIVAAALALPIAAETTAVAEPAGESRSLLGIDVSREIEGETVLFLETDGAADVETFSLENPDRLVLDLEGVVNRVGNEDIEVRRDGVERIRARQNRPFPDPMTRVVVDLTTDTTFRVESDAEGVVVRLGTSATDATHTAEVRLDGDGAQHELQTTTASRSAPRPATQPNIVTRAYVPPADEKPVVDDAAAASTAEEEAEAELDTTDWVEVATLDPEPSEPATDSVTPAHEHEDDAEPTPETTVETTTVPVTTWKPATPPTGTADTAVATTASTEIGDDTAGDRAVSTNEIERWLSTPPSLAAPSDVAAAASAKGTEDFSTRKIVTDEVVYSGKRISLNLVDADIKQLFRLFHDVSGLNFVLDPSVDGRVTVVLDNVPWDQALDLVLKNNGLDKVLENNVIRIAPTQKLASEAAQRKALKEAKELEVEPVTITRTLSYAKAEDVEEVIRSGGILSPRGEAIVDERTNTLIISDIPKKIGPLDQLISTLDTETPQVMIEARIVETSRQFVQDLGVVWGFAAIADASRGTSTGVTFPNNASVRYGLNLPGDGAASNLAFKFGNVVDSFTLDVALNTLETEGRGRVLSSPKIATQNNEQAEIEQGVRIPVVNTTATEIDVQFVSASLRLEVTPQITAEGTVILDIVVENNSPDFQNTVGDIPPINTQRAQTKVLIADGGTTVIGGIFTVNEGSSEAGVPWFRKLPGLGWLFKTTNVTQQNRELLIFLTPRIMKIG